VYALRTWSLNDEVGLIRERQDDVRDRLARIEAQREDLESEIEQLHARIDYLVNQTP
jgi:predicted  nucleic acid-binding Zn-ribbon protein